MLIILNGKTIGETSSAFMHVDKAAKQIIFSSDGDDIVSRDQSGNSLTRLLGKHPTEKGDRLVLWFGETAYRVSDMQLILDEHGIEVAMRADIVGVVEGVLDLTGSGEARVWTYLGYNLSAKADRATAALAVVPTRMAAVFFDYLRRFANKATRPATAAVILREETGGDQYTVYSHVGAIVAALPCGELVDYKKLGTLRRDDRAVYHLEGIGGQGAINAAELEQLKELVSCMEANK